MPNSDASAGRDERRPFPLLFVEPDPALPDRSPSFDVMEKVAGISGRARPTGRRDKVLLLHSIPIRDVHCEELGVELAQRGVPHLCLHTEEFLQSCRMSLRLGQAGETPGVLHLPTGDLALDEVRSVWFRGPGIHVGEAPGMDAEAAVFARREAEGALFGLMGVLGDAFWVNPPRGVYAAEDKMAQLRLARSLGLLIPRTLVTNDPAAAREFYSACRGDVILKTFGRLAGYDADGREKLILTNRVLTEHLDEMQAVRHAPCFFQEYVPKDVELRVTVAGRQVFAAEIHSQQSAQSRDDYRRYDLENTPYRACTLPPRVEDACLRVVEHYGLSYGALDLIRRPDGAYVFLEINANAQFLWIQDMTGMPILQALAEMLVRGSINT